MRVKESVWRGNAEGESSYKPRGTEIRLNKQEGGDGQRQRRRERWFQHRHLSDLEGTYVSASRFRMGPQCLV